MTLRTKIPYTKEKLVVKDKHTVEWMPQHSFLYVDMLAGLTHSADLGLAAWITLKTWM